MTERAWDQRLVQATYPTLVVAAVPFADDNGVVRAAFGVLFHCDDGDDHRRRVDRLRQVTAGFR